MCDRRDTVGNHLVFLIDHWYLHNRKAETSGPGAGVVVKESLEKVGKGFPGTGWKRLLCMSRMFPGRHSKKEMATHSRVG